MCLIVFKEDEKSVFTNRQFKNMIRRNRNGLGIMWREDGRVKVDKSVGHEREKFALWQKYRHHEQYAMHARLTTHGETNLINCHPYEILNMDKGDPIDLYMMHNGVIHQAPDVDKLMSDTWHFVEYILKPIAKANLAILWDNDEFQTWLQKVIGSSKLLFMRSDDVESPILILNASGGKEENGCWLSNAHSTNTTHVNYAPARNHFAGGTHSKGNFTETKATTTIITKGKELPWHDRQDALRLTDANFLKEKTSRLFLPNANESGNIIELNSSEVKFLPHYEDPNQHLFEIVSNLNGLTTHSIKEWVKEDPDLAADVVLALYEKNTMPYEMIIQQIKDKDGIDGIVDIIRHIVSFNTFPITKNVS